MTIRRIATVQGHPTPKSVGSRSSLDPAITQGPQRMEPYDGEEFPPGATVLNGMGLGVDMYQCDHCQAVVAESEVAHHTC